MSVCEKTSNCTACLCAPFQCLDDRSTELTPKSGSQTVHALLDMLCMCASSGTPSTAVCPLWCCFSTVACAGIDFPSVVHDKHGHHAMQVLQFVHGIVAPLADVPVAELALQVYLQAAYSASEVAHLEMIAYEFMEQACLLTCT